MSEATRIGRGRAIVVLILLATVLKLAVLLAPPRDLWPGAKGCDEELWRGTSAKELIDGPLLPLLDHQINDFSGGSLVMALLDVPLFLAFGPTVVAMRLATIPFQLLGLVCLFLMLDRWVGRRAAWTGGLLFALPPPGYSIVSATAWGTHVEGVAIGLLLALLYLSFHERVPRSQGLAFAMGCVAGFALYFGYVALVLIAALVLLELVHDRRSFVERAFLVRLAGFAIGFSPWIVYNLTHDLGGLEPYNRGIGEHVAGRESWANEALAGLEFVGPDQAAALYLPDVAGASGDALEIGLFALLAALALAGAYVRCQARFATIRAGALRAGSRWHPAAIALAYLPLYLLAYVFSDFRVEPPAIQDYRYALPPYPWILVLAATAVEQARPPFLRRAANVAVGILALAFAAGTLARCEFGHARERWADPGYSDTVLARTIFLKFPGDHEMLGRVVSRLSARPAERQHQTLFVLGQNYKQMLLPKTRYGPRMPPRELYEQSIDFLHAAVAPDFRPYFERPLPDERGYRPLERERFWQDRATRLEQGG